MRMAPSAICPDLGCIGAEVDCSVIMLFPRVAGFCRSLDLACPRTPPILGTFALAGFSFSGYLAGHIVKPDNFSGTAKQHEYLRTLPRGYGAQRFLVRK
jgi:hypothetical protein